MFTGPYVTRSFLFIPEMRQSFIVILLRYLTTEALGLPGLKRKALDL